MLDWLRLHDLIQFIIIVKRIKHNSDYIVVGREVRKRRSEIIDFPFALG